MIPHIEKVCRGDKTLGYEVQGSLRIVRGGSIYNKGRVAFWIACNETVIFLTNSKLCNGLPAKGLSEAASSSACAAASEALRLPILENVEM